MTKKLLSLLLALSVILTMAASFGGCSKKNDGGVEEVTTKVSKEEKKKDSKTTTAKPEELDSDGNFKAMDSRAVLIPTSSIMLTLLENDLKYSSKDAEFVWTAVQYALSNYGLSDSRAQLGIEDGYVIHATADLVKEMAFSMFSDLKELPAIPGNVYFVTKDSTGYNFNMTNQTTYGSRIVKSDRDSKGIYKVTAELYNKSSDKTIATATFSVNDDYRIISNDSFKKSVG